MRFLRVNEGATKLKAQPTSPTGDHAYLTGCYFERMSLWDRQQTLPARENSGRVFIRFEVGTAEVMVGYTIYDNLSPKHRIGLRYMGPSGYGLELV